MPVSVLCPHCSVQIKSSSKHAGRVVSCPACGQPFQLPDLAPAPPAVPVASPFDFDGTPATTPRLISCKACGHAIGTHALSCPRCGQMNDWTHPEIQRFIDHFHRIKLPKNCKYFANRDKMDIEATPPTGAARWLLFGLASIFVGVPCGGAALLWLPAQAATWIFGCFLLLFPLFCLMRVFIAGFSFGDVIRCSVDFSEDPPRWTTDNPTAWREVKRFFGL